MSAESLLKDGPDVLLSVRETRLMVERIMLLTGLPPGAVSAAREMVIAAEGLGLNGLVHLRDNFDSLRGMQPTRLKLLSDDELDAQNEHAWSVGPAVLDIAVAQAFETGKPASLLLRNVRHGEFLAALVPLALRQQADVTVAAEGNAYRITAADKRGQIAAADSVGTDAFLAGMLKRGFPTERALWADIYELSNRSLTPDSVVSRRHAGPIILDDQGRIIGRTDDDETDFSLLTGAADSTAAA
ncbi:hypothetical protein [Ferrovibrio sp.]|uniref:hypothetical protein n=1 Tax=Ferrovibrio sp. TaxID=1917215 RepID=UPI0035B46583